MKRKWMDFEGRDDIFRSTVRRILHISRPPAARYNLLKLRRCRESGKGSIFARNRGSPEFDKFYEPKFFEHEHFPTYFSIFWTAQVSIRARIFSLQLACGNLFFPGFDVTLIFVAGVPNDVERFIFEHVDSVGFLEVLLVLHEHSGKEWTAQSMAAEVRGNVNAVEQFLQQLKRMNVIVDAENSGSFKYSPATPALENSISALAQTMKVHRHRIYELIFSPLKKARDFADAFTRSSSKDEKEDGDG